MIHRPTDAPVFHGQWRRCRNVGLSVLAALALAASGCRPSLPRADLVICNGAEPESLDPALITGQADLRVVGALFEGLTRFNPKTAAAEPSLADRWTISPDGRIYTFHMRTNIAWSTGEPITATDVVYSWRRVVDPATASDYAGQLFFVRNAQEINAGKLKDFSQLGVHAVSPDTVRVELVDPTAFFLELCASRTLAVVPEHAIKKHGDRWVLGRPLPVNGAYQLEFWRIHDRIRFKRNPRYWDAANVRTPTVDFISIQSPTTALNLYATGQADLIWDKDLIPTELLDLLRTRSDFHTYQYLGSYFMRFNTTRPPFGDARVRRAFAAAIDKKRIVERITRAGEPVATHLVPKGIARYEPPAGLEHNPDLARQLLAQAGFPEGRGFPRIRYLFNSGKLHEQIAVEFQEMWQRELGVSVELRQSEMQVYLAAQSALDYDLCRASWIGDYNDPTTFLDLFTSHNGNNRTGWKNEAYDKLLRTAKSEGDVGRRAALLQEAEIILVREEMPIMPIYFYVGVNLFDPQSVRGIHFNILDEHPLHAISVARRR